MNFLAIFWVLIPLWGAAMGLSGLRRRPALAERRRQLGSKTSAFPTPKTEGRFPLRFAARLGRLVRSLAGRPPDPLADRRLGLALLAAATGSAVDLRLGVLAGAGSWLWGCRSRVRSRRKAAVELRNGLPEVLDLFALSVSAGLSVRQALDEVAPRCSGRLGEALEGVRRRIRVGVDTAEAFEELPETYGEELRELVRPLVNSLRYGTSLADNLSQAADQARLEKRRQAERSARMVPLKLLAPLSICVLPAFVLLTIVPSLAGSLDFLDF